VKRLSIGWCAMGATLLTTALLASCGTTAPPKKAAPAATCVPADVGKAGPGHFRYNTSACENGTNDVSIFTLPLHKGTSHGQTVYYVVMDTSDQALSDSLGVNFAPKLANAKGTKAVQVVTMANGLVDFPGTVSFGHKRVVTPGPTGFPPAQAVPPSVGDAQYSPLIQLPSGVFENAPQVANNSGQADKVVTLDTNHMTVTYRATQGFYENKMIHYASFDGSIPVAAALEDVTLAANLNDLPKPGDEDPMTSAREELIAFVNGPTGATNPFGQGLSYAILSNVAFQSPKNLLHETPVLPQHADVGSTDYTPMWDVHLAEWTTDAVAAGDRTQLRDIDTVADRYINAMPALVTGPGGMPFGPNGFVVDCPLVSIDIP
jgi:hypothetical protein